MVVSDGSKTTNEQYSCWCNFFLSAGVGLTQVVGCLTCNPAAQVEIPPAAVSLAVFPIPIDSVIDRTVKNTVVCAEISKKILERQVKHQQSSLSE